MSSNGRKMTIADARAELIAASKAAASELEWAVTYAGPDDVASDPTLQGYAKVAARLRAAIDVLEAKTGSRKRPGRPSAAALRRVAFPDRPE